MDPCPLVFEPIFLSKLWGGRRMETLLGKGLPPREPIGESWEIADTEQAQSVVARGDARGKTLHELIAEWGPDLLGRAKLLDGRFPLIIKFLDAVEPLSIQVHPSPSNVESAGQASYKNEAWYIVDAADGAAVWRGLKPGIDAAALRSVMLGGGIQAALRTIPARKGHCFYIPAGTIHTMQGVLVAEVQTAVDITYRIDDFGRVDAATGKPRELHHEQALAATRLNLDPTIAEQRQHIGSLWTSVTSLIRCDDFVIERVRIVEGMEQPIPHQEMVIWIVLEGKGTIRWKSAREPFPFSKGDTVLIPAAIREGHVRIEEECMWLEVTLPIPSSLSGFPRPKYDSLRASDPGLVQLSVPKRAPDS